MRIPIKINSRKFPIWLSVLLRSKDDPRMLMLDNASVDDYEKYVTAVKIGDTWKSTHRKRHQQTDKKISEIVTDIGKVSILEIGVSTGITSMELMDLLGDNFKIYYATDIYFSISLIEKGANTYFYSPDNKECIMMVSDYILMYNDFSDSFLPLKLLTASLFDRAPVYDDKRIKKISFVHPLLRQFSAKDERVVVMEYDMFQRWAQEKVNLIKVANVLNRTYFNEYEIRQAIQNFKDALLPSGYLVIVDNKGKESSSIFRLGEANEFELIDNVAEGCDVKNLVI